MRVYAITKKEQKLSSKKLITILWEKYLLYILKVLIYSIFLHSYTRCDYYCFFFVTDKYIISVSMHSFPRCSPFIITMTYLVFQIKDYLSFIRWLYLEFFFIYRIFHLTDKFCYFKELLLNISLIYQISLILWISVWFSIA